MGHTQAEIDDRIREASEPVLAKIPKERLAQDKLLPCILERLVRFS